VLEMFDIYSDVQGVSMFYESYSQKRLPISFYINPISISEAIFLYSLIQPYLETRKSELCLTVIAIEMTN